MMKAPYEVTDIISKKPFWHLMVVPTCSAHPGPMITPCKDVDWMGAGQLVLPEGCLDFNSACVALQIPLAMDAIGSFVVAASAPLDIRVWRVDTQAASKLTGDATTTLTLVRELSIMSVGQPLRVGDPLQPDPCLLESYELIPEIDNAWWHQRHISVPRLHGQGA